MKYLLLDGGTLNASDLHTFIKNLDQEIAIAEPCLKAIRESRNFVDNSSSDHIIYGVNTGFGPMASRILAKDQVEALQINLIRSHAVGMGPAVENSLVLAAMVVRLNTLVRGASGVSEELINRLVAFINNRVIPVVPLHGSVGASGDLVQLAHIALGLIGEGQVSYQGQIREAKEVVAEIGLQEYKLKPKEGLSLINGTAMMTGVAGLLISDSENLLELANLTSALSLELVSGYSDGISEALQQVRPHSGQIEVAKALREILKDSQLLRDRDSLNKDVSINGSLQELKDAVQEVYSLRCSPQILGPINETLATAKKTINIELNSVTDNPIIDSKSKLFLHGGNFHGDYVAVAMDQLKASLVRLTMLSERRTNFFLNDKINKRFPPFLNLATPGLTLALQGLQFVATSTTAQSQSLAFPHHIHSIPTNGDNQDIVSMGTDAAYTCRTVVDNAYIVIAIEIITLCQAVDVVKIQDKLSSKTKALYSLVRTVFPVVVEDKVIIDKLENLTKLLKNQI